MSTTGTLEERVRLLEDKLAAVEDRLGTSEQKEPKRGGRWFVGIHANNPRFEEAVSLGQEWRNADRPSV